MNLTSTQKTAAGISLLFIVFGLVGIVIFGLDFFKARPDFRGDFRILGLLVSVLTIVWTGVCMTWIKGISD